MNVRVIDQDGNPHDYDADVVPRIGERIVLSYGSGTQPVEDHFFRVRDVMYRSLKPDHLSVAILVEEERNPTDWPS